MRQSLERKESNIKIYNRGGAAAYSKAVAYHKDTIRHNQKLRKEAEKKRRIQEKLEAERS